MSLFFMGINPRYQMFKWLPRKLNIMYSAAGCWDGRGWRRFRGWPGNGLRFFDPGGFTLLNLYGDYPFSVVNWANWIAKTRPHFYASMDYPCEPEISRSLNLMSNQDRIMATVENTIKLAEFANELPGQIVPVIQGYSLEEYQYCLDLHSQAGTIRPYMAIGSMCRRISTKELNELIPGIYYHARQYGVERLHYFGLKLSPKLVSLSQYIHSRDSAVVLDDYSQETRIKRGGRRFPKGVPEKQQAFLDFFGRLDRLGLKYQKT